MEQKKAPVRDEPMLSAYLHQRGVRLGIPIGGSFELTPRCNFSCKMCYVHLSGEEAAARGKELTAAEWIALAKAARDKGMMFLLLTGGEPFLRPDFEEIYTACVKMGLMISVNTNGSLYNDRLAGLFQRYPPYRINVTLYGGCNETYRSLCGVPAYDTVIANLRRMKAEGLSVRVNLSITPFNAGDLEKIHADATDIGLHVLAAAYMFPPVRRTGCAGVNAGRFTACEAAEALVRWHRISDTPERFQARIRSARSMMPGEPTQEEECAARGEGEGIRCRAGRSSLWMTWDGRMTPCGTMAVQGVRPLEIGFDAAWEQTRAFAAAIRMHPDCRECEMKDFCGVCPAIAAAETGAFAGKPGYLCRMAAEKRKLYAEAELPEDSEQ